MQFSAQSAVRCGAVRCGAVKSTQHAASCAPQDLQIGVHAGFFARVAVGRAAKAQGEWQRRPLQRGRVHWELTWRDVEADAAPSHGQAGIFLIGSFRSESVNQ